MGAESTRFSQPQGSRGLCAIPLWLKSTPKYLNLDLASTIGTGAPLTVQTDCVRTLEILRFLLPQRWSKWHFFGLSSKPTLSKKFMSLSTLSCIAGKLGANRVVSSAHSNSFTLGPAMRPWRGLSLSNNAVSSVKLNRAGDNRSPCFTPRPVGFILVSPMIMLVIPSRPGYNGVGIIRFDFLITYLLMTS